MSFYIGIDPPKGFALWDTKKRAFETITTSDFWKIVEDVKRLHDRYNWGYHSQILTVVIEDPAQNKGIYARHWKHDQGHKMTRLAKNVGMNQMCATLLIEYCRRHNIPHQAVRPTKRSLTKMHPDRFQKLTGYVHRTSEHGRDAAMLVWGT